jgi:hypothetical protein
MSDKLFAAVIDWTGRPRIGYHDAAGLQYAALFSLRPVYKKVYRALEGFGLQTGGDIND